MAGLFALVVESLVVLRMVAGRRSAFGFNAFVQVALATILLIGVNLWSAGSDIDLSGIGLGRLHSEPHFARVDTTRNRDFTLPPELLDDLRQLGGETTIIVYDRNRPFGKSPERQDAKDQAIQNAAERVVVEKLKDLLEQFREQGVRYREFGARFKIEVLDVDDENIETRLTTLTQNLAEQMVGPNGDVKAKAAELRKTIEDVPENSIFIVSGDRVQRLSFNDFYYLDKKNSRAEENLVLLYQGAEPLARKIMNIDEKKPVVGVLVVHEYLTTQSKLQMYSLALVKKALESRGFEVRDLVLKKGWEGQGEPEAAVLTFDESRHEQLEEELTQLNSAVRDLELEVAKSKRLIKQWKESTLAQLAEAYKVDLRGRPMTEELRQAQLRLFERGLGLEEVSLKQLVEERDTTSKEMANLSVDRLAEQRRLSDIKYKLDRELAECDLIIVPRMSLVNVSRQFAIPNSLHHLQDAQVQAVKDYLKKGKPALFSFGPSSENPNRPGARAGSDGIDDLLGQLGFVLNRQTVMFDKERKSFTDVGGGLVLLGDSVEIPPLEIGTVPLGANLQARTELPANPVAQALQIAESSFGKEGLNLQARHPRPIGFDPDKLKELSFDPVFMITTANSWNENNPFPGREGSPRPNLPDDAGKGDPNAERRGPFAVGLAVEEQVPRSWYGSGNARPATVRVALLGHGHLFVDDAPDQSLAKDTMLLTLSNWLLGRDDLLPRADRPWSYPRVELEWGEGTSDRWLNIWRILAFGLPFLFIYAGAVVYLMRRVR